MPSLARPALLAALLAAAPFSAAPALAQPAPAQDPAATLGGAPAVPARTIADVLAASGRHGRFLDALKAAGLDGALAGPGPFTVFAPTDAAFARLPAGTVAAPATPEARHALTLLLDYHVVGVRRPTHELATALRNNGGRLTVKTVNGRNLVVTEEAGALTVTDAEGGKARVGPGDVEATNGVVHAVDAVLRPGT